MSLKHNFINFQIIKLIVFLSFIIYINTGPDIQVSHDCDDENCLECSLNGANCYKCKSEYSRHNGHCGIDCDTLNLSKEEEIAHCSLCIPSTLSCLKCSALCKINEGECSCTEKIVIITVCCVFILGVFILIIYCLNHQTIVRFLRGGGNQPRVISILDARRMMFENEETKYKSEDVKPSKEALVKDFEKSQIVLNIPDIEKKKCDYCQLYLCNFALGCGCLICFDCQKNLGTNKQCKKCKKEYGDMKQVTCSICFENQKVIGKFICPCHILVCLNCYLKWRMEHKLCPVCKGYLCERSRKVDSEVCELK